MSYAIVYSSRTGNTKLLAEKMHAELSEEYCVYYGRPDDKALNADLLFVGFWTDKGTCDEDTKHFLEKLHDKKVFLFGTAGFGGSQQYFDSILERVKGILPEDNHVIGSFMCQGKMPMSVRRYYESNLCDGKNQKEVEKMIENFDMALVHPDETDMSALVNSTKHINIAC